MKRTLRRFMAGLVACCMLLSGCKGKEEKKDSVYETKIDKEVVYELVKFELSDEIKGDIREIATGGERLYISTCEWEEIPMSEASETDAAKDASDTDASDTDAELFEEYEYNETYYLYSSNLDGSDVKLLSENSQSSKDNVSVYLYQMFATREGLLYGFYTSYDRENEKETSFMKVYDVDGTVVKEFDLQDVCDTEQEYISSVLVDADGNTYFVGEQNIYIVDAQGKKTTGTFGSWIMGSTVTKDGRVVVCYSEEDKNVLSFIDNQGKPTGDKIELKTQIYSSESIIASGNDKYLLYINSGNDLYGIDKDGNQTKVINWLNSNISAQDIYNICDMGETGFLVIYSSYSDSEQEAGDNLYRLQKVNPEDVAEKTTISFGGLWIDDDLKAQAIRFNQSQDKYQVVIKDYSEYENPEERFNNDLLAGDVPDIIDLGNMNGDLYIAKGMLEDLYPYLEKDAELDKSDFQEQILKLMETDGKLYHITNCAIIRCMVMRDSDLQGKEGLTLQEFIELEKSKGGESKGFYMMSNEAVLDELCGYNADYFIDWVNGSCKFDSPEFVQILEYANTYPKEEEMDYENSESMPVMVQNNELIAAESYDLTMEELEMFDKLYEGEEKFVGYPSVEDSGISVTFYKNYGISSKSENKEGAWEFLHTLLTREYYSKQMMYNMGIPLRKDCLEDMIKRNTATEAYTDDFGTEINPLMSGYGYEDYEVEIGPLTKEQEDKFRDVVARIDREVQYNPEIQEIIKEEAAAFFDGQKTAEDVAGIIQNRVSTYINENR